MSQRPSHQFRILPKVIQLVRIFLELIWPASLPLIRTHLKPYAQVCKTQPLCALAPGPTQCREREERLNKHSEMDGAHVRLTSLLFDCLLLSQLRASDQVITGNEINGIYHSCVVAYFWVVALSFMLLKMLFSWPGMPIPPFPLTCLTFSFNTSSDVTFLGILSQFYQVWGLLVTVTGHITSPL